MASARAGHRSAADKIFTATGGGRIHTGTRTKATVLAVSDGRIAAVGGEEVLDSWKGPRSEIIELHGRMLIPGFHDAHIHPSTYGALKLGYQCDLTGVGTITELQERIREFAGRQPELPWITGAGWSLICFPEGVGDKRYLDELNLGRPIFIRSAEGHIALADSLALEKAGITKDTPDPPCGRIGREADGAPNGMLADAAALLVEKQAPHLRPQQIADALAQTQKELFRCGVTGWQDALVDLPVAEAYQSFEPLARVSLALLWDMTPTRKPSEQIKDLVRLREKLRKSGLRANTVKIIQDGVIESRTAALIDPYLDIRPPHPPTGDRGPSNVPPELLKTVVTELDRADFQVHFHAMGDRAVREALGAFEAARRANGRLAHRPCLAHVQVVQPNDIPRFADLGVSAIMQPLWAFHYEQMDKLNVPLLGEQRSELQYPFKYLLDAFKEAGNGARLAAGSDAPVSSFEPLKGIHVAVNRVSPDRDQENVPFLPGQRLSCEDALNAYTAGSTYLGFWDDAGTLEPGNLADLVILDRDILTPREDIIDAQVESTYVGGKEVF